MIANETTIHKRPTDTEINNFRSLYGFQQCQSKTHTAWSALKGLKMTMNWLFANSRQLTLLLEIPF